MHGADLFQGVQVSDVFLFPSDGFIDNTGVIFSTAPNKVHQDAHALTSDKNSTFRKSVKDAGINRTQPVFGLRLYRPY